MIVETRPLHKKKKRLLLRQQTLITQSNALDPSSDAAGGSHGGQNKQMNEVIDTLGNRRGNNLICGTLAHLSVVKLSQKCMVVQQILNCILCL